jgi:threonine aldolase
MDKIDLRSDTVTWPTPQMRQAMMEAEVGDDVYGEDPTVNELERRAARKFGKEAGLFVSSGSMGNIISLMVHGGRGERAIMGHNAHTHANEGGNPAALGGIQPWVVPVQPDGTLRLEDIRGGISDDDPHYPKTTLVCLENTQGATGGQPLSADYIQQVGQLCREYGLKLHIDGARIFNAAAATETDVSVLTAPADSVTFCLSKGLCAPAGSVIVGSQEFIDKARRIRKLLGGAMRQAGILAAAGLIALEEMTQRLHEDHTSAKMLAEGLAQIPGIEVQPERVKTNMVFLKLREDARFNGNELAQKLEADNIILRPSRIYHFRAVTHYWIEPAHIQFVLERIKRYLA